jgi:hypothetical protein
MGRSLTLEPRKIDGRPKPWMLWVPATLSDTSKVKRLFFETKREAETAAGVIRTRAENFGRGMVQLTPAQSVEAAAALDLLVDRPGVSLLAAVRGYLARQDVLEASIPFADLFEEFLSGKAKRDPKYLKSLGHTREKFRYLDRRTAAEIEGKELADALNKMPPASRNANMRHLRAVFNLGIKRGYVRTNPIASLDFHDVERAEVEVSGLNKSLKCSITRLSMI